MSRHTTPPPTALATDCQHIIEEILGRRTVILCGRNNSGKSFVLRHITRGLGPGVQLLSTARFHSFSTLPVPNKRTDPKEIWQSLQRPLANKNVNPDTVEGRNIEQTVCEMSDSERSKALQLVDRLLNSRTSIERVHPENSLSAHYVSVDGHGLQFCSSGYRLVFLLAHALANRDNSIIVVDEPEIGLSPEVQGEIAGVLLDEELRESEFPHIRLIVMATHSAIFLDRRNISNNFNVTRAGSEIAIRQISGVQELSDLQFRLLGNRFETLFLPSAIVLVEGETDEQYLSRVLRLRYPDAHVAVVACGSDNRIKQSLSLAHRMMGNLSRSPYSNRVFAVLDARHGASIVDQLVTMGMPRENVVVWSRNGIEHYYPRSILERIFSVFDGELVIDGDRVTANGQTVTKKELAQEVSNHSLDPGEVPDELKSKLLEPLSALLS